ncbi:unnamed protein product [Pseudo-nitzschia multistriata]|uniref:Uncharacterized protein n=1 Tax=Pseudo-nitzschia multistriata TaxID=183589 RepID=A0A448YYN2_9STRA|nr:unnamed protein product [Pseudo-nitzschia multistriata]
MGQLVNLEFLYLNDNKLDGTIPSELSGLFMLREIDLSSNAFSGSADSLRGDRPSWGNVIDTYTADCLTGNMTSSCATNCSNEQNHCCGVETTGCVGEGGNH